jgi:hypothetical protein
MITCTIAKAKPMSPRKAGNAVVNVADKMAPRIARAFRRAVEGIRSETVLKELAASIENALASGITEAAVQAAIENSALDTLSRQLKDLVDQTRKVYAEGANIVEEQLPRGFKARFSFDEVNPRAAKFLHEYRMDLITRIGEDSRAAIRAAVQEGVARGANPVQFARTIRDHIGMTEAQAKAAMNYRRMLESGDPGLMGQTLTRALRDARYDGTVERAAEAGRRLPQAKINELVDRYIDRSVKLRAETIGRSESIRAAQAGNHEGWKQFEEQLPEAKGKLRRFWAPTQDERTREAHMTIPELNPEGVGLDEPFESILGPIMFPGDPDAAAANTINCRCAIYVRITD